MGIPYLEFYLKHGISPVTQSIADKKKFFIQRQYLYQSLGIAPSFLKDKSILEFGPGNGVNAIFNYSHVPKKCILVDGNPLAIINIQKNFSEHFHDLNALEIVSCLFDQYNHQPIHDLVICENFIAHLDPPVQMAVMFSKNVKPGGIFFLTCNDAASLLPETLRSLIGLILTREIKELRHKAQFLADYFSTHLLSLDHVGRSFEDWVLDNILQERYALYAPLFSISQAVQGLGDTFTFYHSSPALQAEMCWYKSVNCDEALKNTNKVLENLYYKNIINFLDYRLNLSPHSAKLGKSILGSCEKIREKCQAYYVTTDNSTLTLLVDELNHLARLVFPLSADTAHAVQAYAVIFKLGNFEQMNMDPHLIRWWGRGTQYLTFIKNNS